MVLAVCDIRHCSLRSAFRCGSRHLKPANHSTFQPLERIGLPEASEGPVSEAAPHT